MAQCVYFILAALFCYITCDRCVLQKPQDTLEKKLHDDILCNYESGAPPKSNNTNGVNITLMYIVECIFLNEDRDMLTVIGMTVFYWTDDRLTWDVDKYQGMISIQLFNSEIWSPGVKLRNSAGLKEGLYQIDDCRVQHIGHVKCVSKFEHSVMCNTTIINWPYDTKKCILNLELDYEADINYDKLYLHFAIESRTDWRLTSSEKVVYLNGKHKIASEFIFTRLSDYLEAKIVVPCIVVTVLTLVSILMHINSDVRLGILCSSLYGHFAVCNEISENIPRYGVDTPSILLFISRSISCTLFILFLTISFRCFSSFTLPPPVFFKFLNRLVFKSQAKHFVIPRWNVSMINKEFLYNMERNHEWMDFANVINSIILYVITLAYILLFSLYMPR